MAVYDGFPSIRLEGDEKMALALIPEAKVLLYKLQEFLRNSQVDTYSMSRSVGSEGYIYVRAVRGQYFIHISARTEQVDQTYEEPEVPETEVDPTMLSGHILLGFIQEVEMPDGELIKLLDSFTPTSNTQQVHGLRPGAQPSQRLAVEPRVGDMNPIPTGPVYSQYTSLRSSMYSGRMQKVVQVVMGFGRLSPGQIRRLRDSSKDQAYIDTVKTHGVQVHYDYKYHRTHGITTAADGRLWLVEISQSRGVLAMPLPIYEGSDTGAFIEHFYAKGEQDIAAVCEELGCLPTGESFPSSADALGRRIERGDILQLLEAEDLEEFYKAGPYSSVHGWAFSPDGSEAHNTGYYYGEDGYAHGIWWQINLSIQGIDPNWVPGEGKIASGTASAKLIEEGLLYTPSGLPDTNPDTYLPFKVYDPGLGGLSSIATPARFLGMPAPKCDTPVYVTFINGELHVVKFFRSPQEDRYNEVDDSRTPGECLYAGAWTIEERSGVRGFPTMMYTNVRDDRRVAQEFYRRTDIESIDLGHGPALISDMIEYPNMAWVRRQKHFRNTTKVLTQSGESIQSMVVVPEFSREAYYYAYADAIASETTTTTITHQALVDPNQAYTWRCLAGYGMSGMPGLPSGTVGRCGGECSSFAGGRHYHPERRVVYKFRSEGGCSDFADDGDWPPMCYNVDNQPDSPNYPGTQTITSPARRVETASLRLYMTGIGGSKTLAFTNADMWRWRQPSPHPETEEVHQILAYHNALGSETICFMDDFVGYGLRQFEGFLLTPLTANDPPPCFVGVYQP